jgi:hypothetical protein
MESSDLLGELETSSRAALGILLEEVSGGLTSEPQRLAIAACCAKFASGWPAETETVLVKTAGYLNGPLYPDKPPDENGKTQSRDEKSKDLLRSFAEMFAVPPGNWTFEQKLAAIGFFHGVLVVIGAPADCAAFAGKA